MIDRRHGRQLRAIVVRAVLTIGVLHVWASPAFAQCIRPFARSVSETGFNTQLPACPGSLLSKPWSRPVSHTVDLGVNAALGSLTAGLRAQWAGRPFWRSLAYGALGGAVTYGGKRIIGTRAPVAGFFGRQVAAIGASVVRNAGDGRAPLAGAVFPIGPLRVYVGDVQERGRGSRGARVKLDLAGSVAIAYTATRPGARFDARASVSSATPVFGYFGLNDGPPRIAEHNAGVIALAGELDSYQRRRALAHEMIHVAQYDFSFLAWGEPVERALLWRIPGGSRVHRYLNLGLNVPALLLANGVLPSETRPWEREAQLIIDRPWP